MGLTPTTIFPTVRRLYSSIEQMWARLGQGAGQWLLQLLEIRSTGRRVATLAALSCTAFISGCGDGGAIPDDQPPRSATQDFAQPLKGIINMPAGFELRGNNGTILIDSRNYNMGLRQKGTIRLAIPSSSLFTQLTVAANFPILCLRPSSQRANVSYVNKNADGTFTYFLTGDHTAANGDIEWFLFDAMAPLPTNTNNSGLVVYNARGEVTFNSNYTPMKIAGVVDVALTGTASNPNTIVVDAGYAGTFAACQTAPRGGLVPHPPVGGYVLQDLISITPTGASVALTRIGPVIPGMDSSGSGLGVFSNGGQLLLVDVSNL